MISIIILPIFLMAMIFAIIIIRATIISISFCAVNGSTTDHETIPSSPVVNI